MDFISTGIESFDKNTGGLRKGAVTIIGARPAIGKTQFALSVVKNLCAEKSIRCLYFCPEDETAVLEKWLTEMCSGTDQPVNSEFEVML